MPLNSAIRKHAARAALTAAVASAALTGAAAAATIGSPDVLAPGAKIPINFAGFKEPADNRLPATTASSASTSRSPAASARRRC